jgi:hypothetical protein
LEIGLVYFLSQGVRRGKAHAVEPVVEDRDDDNISNKSYFTRDGRWAPGLGFMQGKKASSFKSFVII